MTNTARKEPKIGDSDCAICCPICNEGKSWNIKRRLHIYHKTGMDKPLVKCFNCSFCGTLGTYLKQVDPMLYHQYINETKRDEFNSLSVDKILGNLKLTKDVKNELVTMNFDKFDFIKATDSKRAMAYLYKRGMDTKNFKEFYYCQDTTVELNGKSTILQDGIVVPLWFNQGDNIIYGFQFRSIVGKVFYTYLPQENSGFKVYNYFDSSRDKLYVFESVFDLMSVDIDKYNKVAVLGSDLPEKMLKETKEIILVLDNTLSDKTARIKIRDYIQKYNVKAFIWPSSMSKFKDFNSIVQNAKQKSVNDICKKLVPIIEKNTFSGIEAITKLELIK